LGGSQCCQASDVAYDLLVRGFQDFVRLESVLEQQSISRDPLSGILDGINTIFHTTYSPILTSGSLGVYLGNTLVPGTADYNTGEITLSTPPTVQPQANYIFTPYTSTQISKFTIQGFLEMESQWTRGWQLLDGSGAWADENSTNAYVVDGNGNDPTCGNTFFSNSRIQIAFFLMCCEYRFMKTQFRTAAGTDYMWRESVRGMTVDKSKRPSNIKLVVDSLREEMMDALKQAQIQFYPGGDQFGGAILNPVTLDYAANYEWQTGAKQNDNWSIEGFNFSYRPLTYFP